MDKQFTAILLITFCLISTLEAQARKARIEAEAAVREALKLEKLLNLIFKN